MDGINMGSTTTPAWTFLETLYPGGIPENKWLLIWSLGKKKRSFWCPDLESASKAVEMAGSTNIYVGCGLAPKEKGIHERCESDEIAGIPGVWLDVDIKGEAHKKANLPPTIEAAIELLAAAGKPPTMILNSGHGLQAWWMFDEVWEFENEEDRKKAAALVKGWVKYFQMAAAKRDWGIDSVIDLARVMRVAGTKNHKTEKVVDVVLLKNDGPRYAMGELWDLVEPLMSEAAAEEAPPRGEGELIFNPDAEIDMDRWAELCVKNPIALLTFRRQRKDKESAGWTASEYDLSLATIAAGDGWTDQDIINLLIHFRRKHGDPKIDGKGRIRADYYRGTLAKLKKRMVSKEVLDTLNDSATIGGKLAGLSTILNCDIQRVIRYTSDPYRFAIRTGTGEISLNGIEDLINFKRFRASIASVDKILIPKLKDADWEVVAGAMLEAMEDEDPGEDTRDKSHLISLLSEYFDQHPASAEHQANSAKQAKEPFVENGKIIFFGSAFREWAASHPRFIKMTPKELGIAVKKSGGHPLQVWHKGGSRHAYTFDICHFGDVK